MDILLYVLFAVPAVGVIIAGFLFLRSSLSNRTNL